MKRILKKLTLTAAVLLATAVSAQAQVAYHDQRADLTYAASGSLAYGRFGYPTGAAAVCYDSQNSPIYIQVESFGTCSYGVDYNDQADGDGFTLYAAGEGRNSPDGSLIDSFQYSTDCECLCVKTDYSYSSPNGCWHP